MPEIIGWKSRKVETFSQDYLYNYNSRSYNRLTLTIWLNRQPDFFLDKIVTGCAMLVVMCIMLFLLTAEEADRFMGAMAIFAGLIAYLFVASQYSQLHTRQKKEMPLPCSRILTPIFFLLLVVQPPLCRIKLPSTSSCRCASSRCCS